MNFYLIAFVVLVAVLLFLALWPDAKRDHSAVEDWDEVVRQKHAAPHKVEPPTGDGEGDETFEIDRKVL